MLPQKQKVIVRCEGRLTGAARRIYKSLSYYLHQKACFGQDKHMAKVTMREQHLKTYGNLKGWNPSKVDGIYSINTMRTYEGQVCGFSKYCASVGFKRVSDITEDVGIMFLKKLEADGKSGYTISTASSALNKAMGWNLSPKALGLKGRKKADIKKCREGAAYTDREFESNKDQIMIARAIGARRSSIYNKNTPDKMIRPDRCVRNDDGVVVGVWLCEKGGKVRLAPVLNEYKAAVTEIVDRLARERGEDKPLFDRYGGHIKNHRLRAEYAAKLLHQLEEERTEGKPLFGGEFPLSDYCCLKGKDKKRGPKTKEHDTDLVAAVSGALGHNRVEVVLRHYMYLYEKLFG